MKQWVEQRGTWENFWWKQNFKLIDQIYFVFYPTHSRAQKLEQGLISTLPKFVIFSVGCFSCAFVSIRSPSWRHYPLKCVAWQPSGVQMWAAWLSRGCVTMSRHAWLGPASDNAEANWCNPLVIIVITQYHPHNPSPDGALTPKWSNTQLM